MTAKPTPYPPRFYYQALEVLCKFNAVLGRRGCFSRDPMFQGNDTTATMTSFVLLVLAIHSDEQVSLVLPCTARTWSGALMCPLVSTGNVFLLSGEGSSGAVEDIRRLRPARHVT